MTEFVKIEREEPKTTFSALSIGDAFCPATEESEVFIKARERSAIGLGEAKIRHVYGEAAIVPVEIRKVEYENV